MAKAMNLFNSATLGNGHVRVSYEKHLAPTGILPSGRSLIGRYAVDYYAYRESWATHEYQISARFKLVPYLVSCVLTPLPSLLSCLWDGGLKEFSLARCLVREEHIGHLHFHDKADNGMTVEELFSGLHTEMVK